MNLNEYVLANHQTALELLRTLCLIPSPSHHEEKRAAFCKAWLMDHGAVNAFIDEAKNVIYEYNAENDVPVAIFMAHIDTVFPESVPLELCLCLWRLMSQTKSRKRTAALYLS